MLHHFTNCALAVATRCPARRRCRRFISTRESSGLHVGVGKSRRWGGGVTTSEISLDSKERARYQISCSQRSREATWSLCCGHRRDAPALGRNSFLRTMAPLALEFNVRFASRRISDDRLISERNFQVLLRSNRRREPR